MILTISIYFEHTTAMGAFMLIKYGVLIISFAYIFFEAINLLSKIKKEPNIKVGDIVCIRDGINSVTHKSVYPYFNENMERYKGKKGIIQEINRNGTIVVRFDLDAKFLLRNEWVKKTKS